VPSTLQSSVTIHTSTAYDFLFCFCKSTSADARHRLGSNFQRRDICGIERHLKSSPIFSLTMIHGIPQRQTTESMGMCPFNCICTFAAIPIKILIIFYCILHLQMVKVQERFIRDYARRRTRNSVPTSVPRWPKFKYNGNNKSTRVVRETVARALHKT